MFQTTNQYNVIICLIPKLCIFFVGRPPIYVRMVQIWKAKTARFAIKCVVSHLETNIYGELWCFLLSYFFSKHPQLFLQRLRKILQTSTCSAAWSAMFGHHKMRDLTNFVICRS